MSNLSTTYLGLDLAHPLVSSAGPISQSLDGAKRLEEGGAAAIVLHSLFEEQLQIESHELDKFLSHGEETYAEALSYFPDMDDYKLGPEKYLEHIRACKEAVSIPVIGSLNGVSSGGWTRFAKEIEQAGADALELNVYHVAADLERTGAEIEQMYIDLVREVKQSISIPIAVKIGPYFSSMANMAKQLDQAGADALVLFNRFYQPDIDLEELEVRPDLVLSRSHELRLRLRWTAVLYGHVEADVAITGGVHTAHDVLKSMMAGGTVAMMTSAALKHGPDHFKAVIDSVTRWMEEHEYESVEQMRGSMSYKAVAEPAAYERANYMKVLGSYAPGVA